MLAENNALVVKKKTLMKVRAQFLHKREEEDENNEVDSATKLLNGNNTFMLHNSLGLVEIGRKICAGPQYLNSHFNIIGSLIETWPTNRMATLNVELDRSMVSAPWEYSTKRLESYGDLDLATLAHRIKKFYANLHKVVSKYEDALQKNDDDITKTVWNQAIMRARNACRDIEKNNEIFYKVRFFFGKDTHNILSTTFSEGLLRAIGFTPESFLKWTEKHGNPTIFDPDCSVFQNAVKMYFDFALFLGNSTYESPEYETFLYDTKGSKRKILVQAHYVLEPLEDGFVSNDYFIVKKVDLDPSPMNTIKFKEPLNEGSDEAQLEPEPESQIQGDVTIEMKPN